MVAKHISMRGELIDMERLRMANADMRALGNADKNARGDTLGPGGVILKTQEQIEQEWAAARERKEAQSSVVNIKSDQALQQALANLAPKSKTAIQQDDMDFNPAPAAAKEPPPAVARQTTTRRRTIESD